MNSCIVCLSSTQGYWWTLALSVCLLLTDIDELLYNISGGQTIQWPKDKHNRRTDNTMTKRQKYQEDRQYNDQKTKISGEQTIQVLSVLLLCLSFGHCIFCPPVIFVFWSLYCLSSCYVCLLIIVLSVLLTIQWPKDKHNRRTDNTMTKKQEYQEDRQYNDQKTNISGGQTIQWPKDKNIRRTDNTMTKRQT
jgi:uncharacterized membrane protein YqjE